MPIARAFNLHKWIDEHRHLLKPPVGNQQVYVENKDFIVMIVGGPNSRKDYHFEDAEELFYQIEGDIVVKIIEDGKPVDIHIKEGEMFLLPPNVPHSPQRGANTVGLVIERYRKPEEKDACMWFCEKCNHKLHEEFFALKDIVKQLPVVLNDFYKSEDKRTCKKCGTVMEPPAPVK
ncbi:MAG: 3-hydroxyanthranilate 3,4-dioxygenase [Bacteroidetes bacterium]|jgi:3-hydroxyanthranilate 3,4-dioxygenase|nr:3-hydroxyanthranilate 3,4-dioxygenase [Bacteroidota bacterium]